MKELISKAWGLPIPGKAMVGMILAGGLFGILYAAGYPQLAYFAGIAMVVLTFVLAAVAMLMKKLDKNKARAVEASVSENAATTGGVSKVADRAKLDDLRRQFEAGIQTFRDYGKDLYSMPWYAMVGEPGSGKTEAIRHSGIGFPPGLQDQLQGTGGTVNMNWWFTDHAVILDTAGRLMFEDVAPGETNEWREFLKLLRTIRKNCPINGMLLVIPADTLITDTPDEIEKKAGKIAQQFDQIQRSLGVRFPVFVLITKADLINGFREFFDDITDPVLTAQMLGWSNPAGLDEPFKPEQVEEHIKDVSRRLLERRFALLHDPVHTEDAKGRRIDQVDALYKFPEAMVDLGPRLRRYLEMIFVAGEWSQKPLFLRGIYFTSSMREGGALDADLAGVLGVSVESLPEGKLWERERSYFLRDMFLDKVFKERGLVTRAANAEKVKRKRAMTLLGAGVVTAIVLVGVTWWSWRETNRRISNPTAYWTSVRDWIEEGAGGDGAGYSRERLGMTVSVLWNRGFGWNSEINADGLPVKIQGAPRTYRELFELAKQHYTNNSSTSGLFGLIANLPGVRGGDVFESQLRVQRRLFDEAVIGPAVQYADEDLIDEGTGRLDWDGNATAALASLLSLQADRVLKHNKPGASFDLSSLVRFALEDGRGGEEPDAEDLADMVGYFGWVYGQGSAWPPEADWATSERTIAAIDAGIERFKDYYSNPAGGDTIYGQLKKFRAAAERFGEAESGLLTVGVFEHVSTTEAYSTERDGWLERYARVESAEAALRGSLTDDVRAIMNETDPAALTLLQEKVRDGIWQTTQKAYDRLLAAFGDENELREDDEKQNQLSDWKKNLLEARSETNKNYEKQVADLFDQIRGDLGERYVRSPKGSPGKMAFEVRAALYGDVHDWLADDAPPSGTLDEILDSIAGAEQERVDRVNTAIGGSEKGVMADARDLAAAAAHAAARAHRTAAIGSEIHRLGDFQTLFDGLPKADWPEVTFAALADLDYLPDYQPAANKEVLAAFARIGGLLEPADGAPGILDADDLAGRLGEIRRGLTSHVEKYLKFWTDVVPRHMVPHKPDDLTWKQYRRVATRGEREIAANVREVSDQIYEAVRNAKDFFAGRDAASAYLAAIEDERANRSQEDQARGEMLDNWTALPADPGTAGSQLVAAADRDNFLDRYFPLFTEDQPGVAPPERLYWSRFAEVGLETLTHDASGDTAAKIRQAEDLARRFPLTLDAPTGNDLSVDEIKRFIETTRGWDLSSRAADDIEEPYDRYPDRIALSLISLRGDALLNRGGRAERLDRAKRVASYLVEQAGKMEFTLASLGYRYEQNAETREFCRQLNVAGRGTEKFDENAILKRALTWDLPLDRSLDLRFKDLDGNDTAKGVLTPWAPLAALNSSPIDARDVVNAEDDIWQLPVAVTFSGRSGVFWIGVQFGKADGLDDLRSDWLKMAQWSRE